MLQRQKEVNVWGTAPADVEVKVSIADKTAAVKAGKDGKWSVTLPELPAGGPYRFTASAAEKVIEFKDVLVGEVWICAGQDNMQMSYKNMKAPQSMIDDMLKRPIRSFKVNIRLSLDPVETISGEWKKEPCHSAIGFYMADVLQKELNVPVAVIQSTCAYTPLEAWLPEKFTEKLPYFKEEVSKLKGGGSKNIKSQIEKVKGEELDYKSAKKIKHSFRHPTIVYNAMLHPVAPYTVRGMTWYQGESNATKSMEESLRYGDTLKMWIKHLRDELWKDENFHFHSVMLTRMGLITKSSPSQDLSAPDAHSWAWFRESQQKILLLPNTGIINTIDGGLNPKILHPKDKDKIGLRAALLKLNKVYKKDTVCLGPEVDEVLIGESSTIVTFKNAAGLKTVDGGNPREFWVAGKDRKWVEASAKISGETVILTYPENMKVEVVRYAFAAYPNVNLINENKLPALPFRTDKDSP